MIDRDLHAQPSKMTAVFHDQPFPPMYRASFNWYVLALCAIGAIAAEQTCVFAHMKPWWVALPFTFLSGATGLYAGLNGVMLAYDQIVDWRMDRQTRRMYARWRREAAEAEQLLARLNEAKP